MKNIKINIPALSRPALSEVQKSWSYIKSIKSDTSTEEACTLELITVLKDGEDSISVTEYETRLPKEGLLGFQHAQWLMEHQSEFLELMVLLGKVYIDFPGLVLVDDGGARGYPCLRKDGKRWEQDWGWISYGFRRDGRVAVASKKQVEKTAKEEARAEVLKEIEQMIVKEINICHHENTPTSRLTSLYNSVAKLKEPKE